MTRSKGLQTPLCPECADCRFRITLSWLEVRGVADSFPLAIVYALDRLAEPVSLTPGRRKEVASRSNTLQSPDFLRIQKRAKEELGTNLYYRRIDVCDTILLNKAIEEIADGEGRMDGLVAAAGIQQETPALEYTAQDANRMFEINITGVFMTAQAVAKQMIRFGNGGSIVMIASMSGTVANRVRAFCRFIPLPGLASLQDPHLRIYPTDKQNKHCLCQLVGVLGRGATFYRHIFFF